jgi:hypothetical protein
MLRASTAINPPLTNPGNRACDYHWGMGNSAVGYTLADAARATGLNKTAILKAIRSGGVKDEHGEWRIEPCELHRVYPEQKALPLEARVVDLEADRNAKLASFVSCLGACCCGLHPASKGRRATPRIHRWLSITYSQCGNQQD